MNEAAAADVLLLRAYESTGFAGWSDADRGWASRSALQAVGADAPAGTFLAARARAAFGRLAAVDPLLPRWQALRHWHVEALSAVIGLAFLVGLAVDHIGSAQRINLLAPPVWAVIAWNLLVYAALLLRPLWASGRPGRLRRALAGMAMRWRHRAGAPAIARRRRPGRPADHSGRSSSAA